MATTHNDAPEQGHNQLEWPKVRKRALLQKTTMSDWEKASNEQRFVMHQIELGLISIIEDGGGQHAGLGEE